LLTIAVYIRAGCAKAPCNKQHTHRCLDIGQNYRCLCRKSYIGVHCQHSEYNSTVLLTLNLSFTQTELVATAQCINRAKHNAASHDSFKPLCWFVFRATRLATCNWRPQGGWLGHSGSVKLPAMGPKSVRSGSWRPLIAPCCLLLMLVSTPLHIVSHCYSGFPVIGSIRLTVCIILFLLIHVFKWLLCWKAISLDF